MKDRARRESSSNEEVPIRDSAELAQALGEGKSIRNGVINSIGDQEEIITAIESLPESTRINAHFEYFRHIQQDGRYAECTDLVSYLPLDDKRTINSVSYLAVHWTRQNPAAATEWIEGLPAGSVKDWAAANASRQWARINPDRAEAWLLGLVDRGEVEVVLGD